jgi:gamma-glutamyltranspeptidase / glutathione hydrolase
MSIKLRASGHATRALRRGTALAAVVLAACAAPAQRPVDAVQAGGAPAQVLSSPHGMVVSGSAIASAIGAAMLEAGGNAVDAAVATAFALSVVEPSMSGIGGRTQILIRTPSREFAGFDGTTQVPSHYPSGATAADEAAYGYGTIGIPGTVAALAAALEGHGTMSLARVLEPSIRLAAGGFVLPADEAGRMASAAAQLAESEGARRYFLRADGTPYRAGERLVQPDLARTLSAIAQRGPQAFYTGEIAQRMAEDIRHNGGWVSEEDLRRYTAEPALLARGSYRGYDITGTYLPASGATTIQILHILENFPLQQTVGTPRWAALLASALLIGFADRTIELGTPEEKVRWLTSKERAAQRAAEIRLPAGADVHDGAWPAAAEHTLEPAHTTHLSVTDAAGGAVALTQSIGPNMGSKVAAPGLGFLYAATMGYLGDVSAGERPWSSQSPLILERDGEVAYVVGAAGARRIISAIVATLSRAIDEGLPLPEAMAAPRLHASASTLDMETRPAAAWTDDQLEAVRQLGFTVRPRDDAPWFARINGIARDPATGVFTGVADSRWTGAAAAPRRVPRR